MDIRKPGIDLEILKGGRQFHQVLLYIARVTRGSEGMLSRETLNFENLLDNISHNLAAFSPYLQTQETTKMF